MDPKSESHFLNRFRSLFLHVLTMHQEDLVCKLEGFLKTKERNALFVLTGYAGTGKTSILGGLVKTLESFQVKSKLMAPTGRAAKVFSLKAGKEAFTIHKQIYRRSSAADEFSKMSLNQNLHANTVFLVDEASMIGEESIQQEGGISRSLLDDLLEYVYAGKNCKLILVGDQAQLPPVGLQDSPALSLAHLQHNYSALSISAFTLTEVLRQEKESGILKNATDLRKELYTRSFRFDLKGFKDIYMQPGDEFLQALEDAYDQYGTDQTIIVTRSNKWANKYNQQIRARILWYEDELCAGDCLMVVRNNYFWVDGNSVMGFVANGELLKVIRYRKTEELYGFRFAHISVRFVDYESMPEMELIVMLDALHVDAASLPRQRMRELFFEVEKDYAYERNKTKRYQLILKDKYFNALQVKYAYAITCHKAQGGQWEQVFVDPGFLDPDENPVDFNRWLYTAITRSTSRLGLINISDDLLK